MCYTHLQRRKDASRRVRADGNMLGAGERTKTQEKIKTEKEKNGTRKNENQNEKMFRRRIQLHVHAQQLSLPLTPWRRRLFSGSGSTLPLPYRWASIFFSRSRYYSNCFLFFRSPRGIRGFHRGLDKRGGKKGAGRPTK